MFLPLFYKMFLEYVLLQNQKEIQEKERHECQDPVALTEKYYTKNSQDDCYAAGLERNHSNLELEAREFQAEYLQEGSKFTVIDSMLKKLV